MKADAFLELRNKIRSGICLIPQTSGGQILDIDTDPDNNDLLITWQHVNGQHAHRIVIKDETAGVPKPRPSVVLPEGMPDVMINMLQATIDDAWKHYGGNPEDAGKFFAYLVGGE